MNPDNKKLYIGLGALIVVVLAATLVLVSGGDDTSEPEVITVNTSENDNTQESENDEQEEADPEETEEPDTPKTPQLSGNVTENPIIANSFGLVPDAPVPSGQTVSSSCTSAANVECMLEFTNRDTNQTIQFEVKETSASGIAIWEWEGGNELPSGTWESVAKAGDKVSSTEVIYVQ